MNEVLKVLKERRSCRKFLPDAVPEELLAQVLEAGTYAASGMGRQSAIMLVVTDPAKGLSPAAAELWDPMQGTVEKPALTTAGKRRTVAF